MNNKYIQCHTYNINIIILLTCRNIVWRFGAVLSEHVTETDGADLNDVKIRTRR